MKQNKSVRKLIPIVMLIHFGVMLWMLMMDKNGIALTSIVLLLINILWMSIVGCIQHVWNVDGHNKNKERSAGSSEDVCGHGIG